MNRVEIADRFARMYSSARHAAGVSQAQAAKAMGVSKTTIQNWENGTSSPSSIQTFVYFKHLGVQPLPYYLQLIYPTEFDWTREQAADEDVDKALEKLLHDLPVDAKRKILYIAYGDHGSSPMAVLDLICAHLHTPLVARVGVAELIRSNLQLTQYLGRTVKADLIMPNMSILNTAISNAKEAVKERAMHYTAI